MRVHGPYDAAILLECDGVDRTRLRGLERFFIINIDHHATGHDFGQLNWIDREAVSVGEMVYRLVKAAGATITPEMATCLYTTVLTDTGGFCYGSMRASTFALAQELVEAGADPVRVAQKSTSPPRISKLLLLGAALNNLQREGRTGLALGHAEGHGPHLRRRRRLRRHRELRPLASPALKPPFSCANCPRAASA